MEKLQGTVPMLRKAAIITLIGFLVITLAGPLLTLAGVLLPFAVVGLHRDLLTGSTESGLAH